MFLFRSLGGNVTLIDYLCEISFMLNLANFDINYVFVHFKCLSIELFVENYRRGNRCGFFLSFNSFP
jgi:hypothetical protein